MQLPGLRQVLVRQQALQTLQALSSFRPSLACPATLPLLQLHFSGRPKSTVPGLQSKGGVQGALLKPHGTIPNTLWQPQHYPSPLNKG